MNSQIPKLLHILLAVDGSEHSLAAARLIGDLPLLASSEVTVLGVLTPHQTIGRAPLQRALDEACTIILSNNNVGVKSGLLHGHPAAQLTEFANQHRPDLMVVGAKGLSATLGILLGGVAQQVVEHALWPVLVVRSPYEGVRRVLLCTDGSPSSRRAADYIAQFPLPRNIELHVMHVLPLGAPEPYITTRMADMSAIPQLSSQEVDKAASRQAEAEEYQGLMLLTQTVDALKASQFETVSVIRSGDAATEILQYAEAQEVSLILTGSRGLSAVQGWLLGSVSRKLIYHSSCSVLVIPEQMEA